MGTSKIKKGKIKTIYFVLFQIKFMKMKRFYDFGPSPNSEESILAV